jgi:hypothetical protein
MMEFGIAAAKGLESLEKITGEIRDPTSRIVSEMAKCVEIDNYPSTLDNGFAEHSDDSAQEREHSLVYMVGNRNEWSRLSEIKQKTWQKGESVPGCASLFDASRHGISTPKSKVGMRHTGKIALEGQREAPELNSGSAEPLRRN